MIEIVNYSEKSFAVIMPKDCYLKDEFTFAGGRFNGRLACGPGWIFSRKKCEDIIANILHEENFELHTRELAATEKTKKKASQETSSCILNDEERRKWCLSIGIDIKNYPVAVRLEGGEILAIHQTSLRTEFWHHDEGPDYERHLQITKDKQTMTDYFFQKNLEDLNEFVEAFEGKSSRGTYKYLWLANWNEPDCNSWSLRWSNINPESVNARSFLDTTEQRMYDSGLYRGLSDNDKQRLMTAYNLAIVKRAKRCQTWLKRYGVEKLHFDTYWADR